jgi:hypothetical protein
MIINFQRTSIDIKEDINSFSNSKRITPKKRDKLMIPTPPILQITDEDEDEDESKNSVSEHEEIEELEFKEVIVPRKR